VETVRAVVRRATGAATMAREATVTEEVATGRVEVERAVAGEARARAESSGCLQAGRGVEAVGGERARAVVGEERAPAAVAMAEAEMATEEVGMATEEVATAMVEVEMAVAGEAMVEVEERGQEAAARAAVREAAEAAVVKEVGMGGLAANLVAQGRGQVVAGICDRT